MRNSARLRPTSILILLATGLGLWLFAEQAYARVEVPWSVELYADNPGYLMVKLDLRSLARNTYLRSALIQVTFFDDQQQSLGEKYFPFDGEQLNQLAAGQINVAYFKHSFEKARSVHGERLEGYNSSSGSSADTGPAIVGRKSGNVEGNADSGHTAGAKPPRNKTALSATNFRTIVAKHSGKCLDVGGSSGEDGAAVIQYTCTGTPNQLFSGREVGDGFVQISVQHSGKCLDLFNGDLDDGAKIVQYSCNGGNNQLFQLKEMGNGTFEIVTKPAGKCFDMAGSSSEDGLQLQQYTCHGGANQLWSFQSPSD